MNKEATFARARRLILAGLTVELFSLIGLYRPWGFLLFSMGGISLIAAGVAFYIAAAIQPQARDEEAV